LFVNHEVLVMIESHTERPASLEDVQRIMSHWIESLPAPDSARIRISRTPGAPKRLLMSTSIHKDLKFEVTQDKVSLEAKSRRISLEVPDFALTAEVDGTTFLVIFQLKNTSQIRPLTRVIDSLSRTEHPVFFSRAFNALTSITNELPAESVEELNASSTDFELLVNALFAATTNAESIDPDPLVRAKLRGVEHRKRILEKLGGTLSAEQVSELIGISRQAVDKRRSQNQLIGLTQGKRGYAYPAFQFENGKTIDGLKEVLDALSGHDPWMQSIFFANDNDRLSSTPVDALHQGKTEAVIRAAEAYGEQGAA
jgi:biotin operon repressor